MKSIAALPARSKLSSVTQVSRVLLSPCPGPSMRQRRHAAAAEVIVIRARHVFLDGVHAGNDQHDRRLGLGAGHRLQNAGDGLAVLERDLDAAHRRLVEQFGEARVAMDHALVELELARRVGVDHAAGRPVIERGAVVELGGAFAMAGRFGLLGELLLLLGGAHPLLDHRHRVLDALGGAPHVGGAEAPFDEHHRAEAEDVEDLVEFLVHPFLRAPAAVVQSLSPRFIKSRAGAKAGASDHTPTSIVL